MKAADEPLHFSGAGLTFRPTGAPADRAILFLHGGAYMLGSAKAYRGLASQVVVRTRGGGVRGRRSAIDGRTTRHGGYAISQRIRKRIESRSAG